MQAEFNLQVNQLARRTRQGAMTVFLILLLTVVLSGIFAILELARYECLKANVKLCTAQAKDAVLASYQPELWKNYHLLFFEAKDGNMEVVSNLQKEVVEGNHTKTWINRVFDNFFLLNVDLTEVTVNSYQLATDNGGIPFAREAASQEVIELPAQLVDYLLEKIESSGDKKKSDETEDEIDDVSDTMKEAENAAKSESSESSTELAVVEESTEVAEVKMETNPVEWIKKLRKDGVLGLLMGDKSISDKTVDLSDSIANRTLNKGNYPAEEELTILEELAYCTFLSRNFGNVRSVQEGRALDYELEYIIAGKDSDRKNLKNTVNRIILIREASNMIYLERTPEKKTIARAVAYTICAAIAGQVEFAEPVMHGVLAVWAYAESLSDVKILLDGGRVPMVKSDGTWNTDLTKLISSLDKSDKDDGSEISKIDRGLIYEDYLLMLLCLVKQEKMITRSMDMLEKTAGVHMDDMVTQMKCSYTFEAEPLFSKLITLKVKKPGTYTFQEEGEISYMRYFLGGKKK